MIELLKLLQLSRWKTLNFTFRKYEYMIYCHILYCFDISYRFHLRKKKKKTVSGGQILLNMKNIIFQYIIPFTPNVQIWTFFHEIRRCVVLDRSRKKFNNYLGNKNILLCMIIEIIRFFMIEIVEQVEIWLSSISYTV